MDNKNEVGQDLSNFTVAILDGDEFVGTGFVVSLDGKIVTCAHVVQHVLDKHPRDASTEEITIYFPQVDADYQAQVCAHVGNYEDDICLL